MKKIMKNRKGFTLIEMIIVIAIIIILASVVFFAIQQYLDAAQTSADSISVHNSEIVSVYNAVFP